MGQSADRQRQRLGDLRVAGGAGRRGVYGRSSIVRRQDQAERSADEFGIASSNIASQSARRSVGDMGESCPGGKCRRGRFSRSYTKVPDIPLTKSSRNPVEVARARNWSKSFRIGRFFGCCTFA